MKSLLQPLLLAACIVAIPIMAQGASIITYSGQATPVDEGWNETILYMNDDPTGTTTLGTGVNDNGTDAWEIVTENAGLRYEHELSDTELADMASGWEASISMRVGTVSYAPYFDANFEVATGNWVASLLFGSDANGNPLLGYLSSWSFVITPIDLGSLNLDSGYHTYKMSATGDIETVSLYVDDNYITDLTALPTGRYTGWEKRILWGDTERGTVALDAFYADVAVSSNVEEPIPGDANGDKKVDGSDVTILAGNWQVGVDGTVEATWEMGDFNGDKKVDGSDVTILAGNWQVGVTAAAASVPEPGMLVLLLGAIAALATIRREK